MIVVLSALACQEINVHLIGQNKSLHELGGEERSRRKLCPTTLSTSNCLYGKCWYRDSHYEVFTLSHFGPGFECKTWSIGFFIKTRPTSLMLLEMEVYYCSKRPRKCEQINIYSHIVPYVLCCSCRFTFIVLQTCSQNMGMCSWQGFEL